MGNVIQAVFNSRNTATVSGLWQYDYGQILQFVDLALPITYEVHFANEGQSSSITVLGDADGVLIPDQFLLTGKSVIAWVFLHTGLDDGETEYRVTMPVQRRAEPTDVEPTPVQEDIITQAIAALNNAITQTGEDREATAISAENAAESARESSSYAENSAESATNAANSAASAAASESNARSYRDEASTFADRAEASAVNAAESAQDAATSETNAQHWEEMAEQAAKNAGYLWFYIEDGKLFMDRTPNTQVDFYVEHGQLFMREVV